MRINNYRFILNGITFALFCLAIQSHAERARDMFPNSRENVKVNNLYMTVDYTFFDYERKFIGNTAQNVNAAIHDFTRFTKLVEEFLKNNDNLQAGRYRHFSAWGGLYSNLPLLTGQKDIVDELSPSYVLSLMFRSNFKQAQKTATSILEKEPDNYGALLLLGILSIYNKENFPYLERAFLMNPYKTVHIFDWHFRNFVIVPSEEWDFVHAYFLLLMKHKNLLRKMKLSQPLALRLSTSIYLKYENPEKPFPNYEEIELEMRQLASIIRSNLSLNK